VQSQQRKKGGKESCDTKEAFASGRGQNATTTTTTTTAKSAARRLESAGFQSVTVLWFFAALCLRRGVTRHSKRFVSAGFCSVIVLWHTQASDDCFGRAVTGHSR